MKRASDRSRSTWRAPTRRAFFSMLGAAAVAAVVGGGSSVRLVDRELAEALRPRRPYTGPTRWIGHC